VNFLIWRSFSGGRRKLLALLDSKIKDDGEDQKGNPMSRTFPEPVFDSVAGVARLNVPAERSAAVRGCLESAYTLIDKLDELDLGETPPATAFACGWE
jgi:hypothetical protein